MLMIRRWNDVDSSGRLGMVGYRRHHVACSDPHHASHELVSDAHDRVSAPSPMDDDRDATEISLKEYCYSTRET
jgi:hypothetical protein